MKNKIVIIVIMLFILSFTVNTNATYMTIEKAENSSELYNQMPTEVKKGDIISVKVLAKDIYYNEDNSFINSWGYNEIHWDSEAFEIVEVNGKYCTTLSDNIVNGANTHFEKKNNLYISFNFDYEKPYNFEAEELFELKFKVKSNVKDDIYGIYLDYSYDEDSFGYSMDKVLKYQVGNPKIISNYTNDKIGNNTYIIGNYMFTREGSDKYNGVLTTDYIMVASKTIDSDDNKDMIVYLKNARGKWIDAITDKEVTPPGEFKIERLNMKSTYQENGIYSDSDYKTMLRLIQISESEGLITINNENELINSMVTINDKVATFTINGKTYKVTILDNEVKIETSDTYIGNKTLQKRTNYTLEDYLKYYFEDYYGDIDSDYQYYINSGHSGKYVFGNYELYLFRMHDTTGRMCLREKGGTECILDDELYDNANGWVTDLEETTYAFYTDEQIYGINWNSDTLNVSCVGNCDNNPYIGTYQKETKLSLEDIIRVWEKDMIKYRVKIDNDNESYDWDIWVTPGDVIDEDFLGIPEKDGNQFKEWQVDGQVYDFSKPITKPITIVATYYKMPDAPTLGIYSIVDGQDYASYTDGVFKYFLSISNNDSYDGFEIAYKTSSGKYQTVTMSDITHSTASINISANVNRTYYARVYKNINGETYYSEYSNGVKIYPRTFTVNFDSNGGSNVESQKVVKGKTASEPTNPTKEGYNFVEWKLNDNAFDFSSPITSNITLVANWTKKTYTVKFNSNGGSSVANQTIEHGANAVKPANPTKDGYTFKEWQLSGQEYDFSTAVTKSITLNAVWDLVMDYTIIATRADAYSPDSILKAYLNDEEISVKEIKYSDGAHLCDGSNMIVITSDIEGETSFILVLEDDSEVTAILK